jgi:hypothetical protein
MLPFVIFEKGRRHREKVEIPALSFGLARLPD